VLSKPLFAGLRTLRPQTEPQVRASTCNNGVNYRVQALRELSVFDRWGIQDFRHFGNSVSSKRLLTCGNLRLVGLHSVDLKRDWVNWFFGAGKAFNIGISGMKAGVKIA